MSFINLAFERLRRAWKYGFGNLSAEEARQVISDCRQTAGWHPLLLLSVDDTLKHIRNAYVDHPALRRLATRACEEIERKCGRDWNELRDAKEWAAKLTRTFAKDEGLVLTKWEDVLPKRLFERGETTTRQPSVTSTPPGWRPTTADLMEHSGETTIAFERTSCRIRGEQVLAAALDLADEAAE
jgi:hypothetical protein